MIKHDVPADEADLMAAQGTARVLSRRAAEGKVMCDVEIYDEDAPGAVAGGDEAPKARRKQKSASKG